MGRLPRSGSALAFCSSCGKPVHAPEAVNTMEPRRIILIMVLFLAALVTSGCVSPDQSNITITPKGEPAFQFNAPDTLTATAGEYFEYSFCDPKPATDTSPCGPMPATSNPTGGNPAYHFVLGSGTGFPPFGLSLGKDGILKGTVDKSEAGRTKTIDVCAVDLSGDSVCREVSLTVSAPPPTLSGIWTGQATLKADVGVICAYQGNIRLSLTQTGSSLQGSITYDLGGLSSSPYCTASRVSGTVPLTGNKNNELVKFSFTTLAPFAGFTINAGGILGTPNYIEGDFSGDATGKFQVNRQ